MTINLHLPTPPETLRPTITVIGIGGAGGNAVNNMIASNLEGVNFIVANTDAQALENSLTERRIQLGMTLTRGLGAGAQPNVGSSSAEESMDEILANIEGSNMLFITAGMGGGTGTGAAPVVARAAREMGILTVAVVTKPFGFEGKKRMQQAEAGLAELQKSVDTMIVIPNQNLFRLANEKTTLADAFRMADEVLHSGVRGVTDLMIMPGLINLDFADIRTVMKEMGKAMMGTGESSGENRAIAAAEAAISNPLLDDVSMKGAKGVLINITGGHDMTLFEVDEAANRVRDEVDPDANIIFGSTFNPALEGTIRVSVVATGIEAAEQAAANQAAAARAPQAAQAPQPSTASAPMGNRFAPRPTAEGEVRSAVENRSRNVVDFAALSKMRAANTSSSKVEEQQENAEEASFAKVEAPMQAAPIAEPVRTPKLVMEEPPVSQEEMVPASISPRGESPVAPRSSTAAPAGGFFARFGLGRTATSEQEDADVMEEDNEDSDSSSRSRSRKTEVHTSASAADEEQEYSDIPAFLRRQGK